MGLNEELDSSVVAEVQLEDTPGKRFGDFD